MELEKLNGIGLLNSYKEHITNEKKITDASVKKFKNMQNIHFKGYKTIIDESIMHI